MRAVITFAKTLGLNVTAEGIETTEQLSQLQSLGCGQGQGYYFSRPLPNFAFEGLLDGSAPPILMALYAEALP